MYKILKWTIILAPKLQANKINKILSSMICSKILIGDYYILYINLNIKNVK